MRYGYEIEALNKRFAVSRSDVQKSINFYFSHHLAQDFLIDTPIDSLELEKLERLHINYLGIPLEIIFVREGYRQIWFGSLRYGTSPISQREEAFGYIEISPSTYASVPPTDVKILCSWPPLYFFFAGMAKHLNNNFENQIYRNGIDAESEIVQQILVMSKNQGYVLGELYSLVESLRRWAISIQKHGLPMNDVLKKTLDELSQDTSNSGGVKSYFEANLPLIPGLLHYKFEFASEHKVDIDALTGDLKKIWEKITRILRQL